MLAKKELCPKNGIRSLKAQISSLELELVQLLKFQFNLNNPFKILLEKKPFLPEKHYKVMVTLMNDSCFYPFCLFYTAEAIYNTCLEVSWMLLEEELRNAE